MKKLLTILTMTAALLLAIAPLARAEEKLLGTVQKLEVAGDGASAVAVLKDSKTGAEVPITVEDKITLDKFKDHRIGVGDEIKCKYDKRGEKNLATYFKKAGGC
jgi:hypothetical protein